MKNRAKIMLSILLALFSLTHAMAPEEFQETINIPKDTTYRMLLKLTQKKARTPSSLVNQLLDFITSLDPKNNLFSLQFIQLTINPYIRELENLLNDNRVEISAEAREYLQKGIAEAFAELYTKTTQLGKPSSKTDKQ